MTVLPEPAIQLGPCDWPLYFGTCRSFTIKPLNLANAGGPPHGLIDAHPLGNLSIWIRAHWNRMRRSRCGLPRSAATMQGRARWKLQFPKLAA
jgi:hypothetical protein